MPFGCCAIKMESIKPPSDDENDDNLDMCVPPPKNDRYDEPTKSLPKTRKIVHRPVEFGRPCDCCGSK